MTKTLTKKQVRDECQVTNGAEEIISLGHPYIAEVELTGAAPLLFHAWNNESVAEKAGAKKGSAAKKTDDVESYTYRTESGHLGIAGRCLHGALLEAGKFVQDPRSPRKSARDLLKAALVVLDMVAPLQPKTKEWDYLDMQRVVIQRSAITRTRPAMKEGWKVTFKIQVILPEYVNPQFLQDLLDKAGKFAGLCDFRPTYGRFAITKFSVVSLD